MKGVAGKVSGLLSHFNPNHYHNHQQQQQQQQQATAGTYSGSSGHHDSGEWEEGRRGGGGGGGGDVPSSPPASAPGTRKRRSSVGGWSPSLTSFRWGTSDKNAGRDAGKSGTAAAPVGADSVAATSDAHASPSQVPFTLTPRSARAPDGTQSPEQDHAHSLRRGNGHGTKSDVNVSFQDQADASGTARKHSGGEIDERRERHPTRPANGIHEKSNGKPTVKAPRGGGGRGGGGGGGGETNARGSNGTPVVDPMTSRETSGRGRAGHGGGDDTGRNGGNRGHNSGRTSTARGSRTASDVPDSNGDADHDHERQRPLHSQPGGNSRKAHTGSGAANGGAGNRRPKHSRRQQEIARLRLPVRTREKIEAGRIRHSDDLSKPSGQPANGAANGAASGASAGAPNVDLHGKHRVLNTHPGKRDTQDPPSSSSAAAASSFSSVKSVSNATRRGPYESQRSGRLDDLENRLAKERAYIADECAKLRKLVEETRAGINRHEGDVMARSRLVEETVLRSKREQDAAWRECRQSEAVKDKQRQIYLERAVKKNIDEARQKMKLKLQDMMRKVEQEQSEDRRQNLSCGERWALKLQFAGAHVLFFLAQALLLILLLLGDIVNIMHWVGRLVPSFLLRGDRIKLDLRVPIDGRTFYQARMQHVQDFLGPAMGEGEEGNGRRETGRARTRATGNGNRLSVTRPPY